MSPAASPRWCPTPEQLMILEQMYRAGVQSPSASLIQQITAQLSQYGKIEGKNVFYWFQNHKARDKQKLRRKFAKQQLQQLFRQQMSPSCSFCHGYQLDHHQCPSSMVVQGPLVPSASALRQLGYYSSPPPPSMSYPPQGGNTDGGASRSIMDLTSFRRREIIRDRDPQSAGIEKNMMQLYNEVRMSAIGMDRPDLHPAKPLKTLELFPTTSTNLREDRCKNASASIKCNNRK